MAYTVYRIELDGSETLVAYMDSFGEYEAIKAADRDKIDFEAGYHCVPDNDEVANQPDTVI